ncbi:MAG: DUF4342 domain-containing protein [Chloroflexota bacterium]
MTEHDAHEVNETESMDGTREKVKNEGKRIIEEIEVAGRDAVSRAQDLIEQGNVRRLIFLRDDDRVIMEVPLTAGVAAGAVAVLIAPTLAAIGAAVAFLAKVKIRVVRVEDEE